MGQPPRRTAPNKVVAPSKSCFMGSPVPFASGGGAPRRLRRQTLASVIVNAPIDGPNNRCDAARGTRRGVLPRQARGGGARRASESTALEFTC